MKRDSLLGARERRRSPAAPNHLLATSSAALAKPFSVEAESAHRVGFLSSGPLPHKKQLQGFRTQGLAGCRAIPIFRKKKDGIMTSTVTAAEVSENFAACRGTPHCTSP